MMKKSFQEILTVEVAKLFMSLKQLDNSAPKLTAFVQELGFRLPVRQQLGEVDLHELIDLVDELIAGVAALIDANTDEEVVEAVAKLAIKIPDVVKAIDTVSPRIEIAIKAIPGYIDDQGDLAKLLPRRITEYLLYNYLQTYYGKLFATMHLLGLIEEVPDSNDIPIKTIQWQRIPKLFSEPIEVANEVYHWNEGPDYIYAVDDDYGSYADKFLVRFEMLLRAFMFPGGIYDQNSGILTALNNPQGTKEIRMPIYQSGVWPENWTELDLNMSPTPSEAGKNAGLVFYPYFNTAVLEEWEIGDGWKFGFGGNVSTENPGIGVKLRAPHEVEVKSDLVPSELSSLANPRLEISLSKESEVDELVYLFGAEDKSYLGLKKVSVKIIVALQNGDAEFAGELDIQDFTININPGSDADGFLQKILSGINIKIFSDLIIGVSNLDGFYFGGSGALEIEIPIHESLGPIKLEKAYIGIGISGDIAITFAVSFGVELGPISASVERIGLGIPIGFSKNNKGNLGPLDVKSPNFLPPTVVALSVNAEEIVFGGGSIEFDIEHERYSGILALNLSEISITAIGLITTKMPDGSKDFSMAVCMYVQTRIELSMGFTLLGVGGMLGIKRAMVIEELQKGVRKGTLNSILFPNPKTIVAKAPQIIEDIRRVFPPAKEKFVVGPMVKIGWGSPNVIQADIGIFLVLPDFSEMALLGKLSATFPTPKESIIKINMYLLGTLSLPKKELTFQSSIYDSEILKISLWGDIAFLLRWSDPPEFMMAIGGFHPKSTPPPPEYIFGDLKRLSLNITWGSAFYLLCQSYIALTPNSLQFGAKLQLIINLEVIKVYGGFSFDVLFYFNPFSFMIDADVYVGLSVAGVNLLDVKIDLHLSGPTPWNARGSAIIHLLFFDVNADFDVIWGQQPEHPLIPAVDPLEKLITALEDNHNWSARLPHTRSMVEALQPLEADGAESLVVHPAGSLQVIQNVLPLGVQLKKFGNAPVTGHDKFMINGISFNGQDQENPKQMITEYLNRGAYEKLSKHDKLSKPSFEKMTVGANFSSDTIVFGGIGVNGDIPKQTHGYESSYINQEEVSKTSDEDVYLNQDDARLLIAGSAAARSKQLTGGDRKFVEANMQPRINKVNELSYAIADIENLTRADIDEGVVDDQGVAEDRSLWHVEQVLEAYIENTPGVVDKYIVVAEYELREEAA